MADGQLTSAQLDALQTESKPGAGTTDLLDTVHRSIIHAIAAVRALDPTTLTEPCGVGRKRLPTTVIGLAIHLAEHTQRHVGQTITTCKVVHSD